MAKKSAAARELKETTGTSDGELLPLRSLTQNVLPAQLLPTVSINQDTSPLLYTPNVPGVDLWQLSSQSAVCVVVRGKDPDYTYYRSFSIEWVQTGEGELTLNGFECPGEPATTQVTIPLVAFDAAALSLVARAGTYQVVVTSVDPATPVSFQMDGQPFDAKRQIESFPISGSTDRFPDIARVKTHPTSVAPTSWNNNPIQVVINSITSDQGEFTGNTAVLYGYYLEAYGRSLQFFVDQGQSQRDFARGQVGVQVAIDPAHSTLVVG